ncbi:MAG: ATP-binding cassette domain-containing protein [Candidatus Nanopelagicales bacterium]
MSESPFATYPSGDDMYLELQDVGKVFGNVVALDGVSMAVNHGRVTCVLGDNGAGKSTLIKILSGVHTNDSGVLKVAGQPTRFGSPKDARDAGIATVFQDLATIPLMSVWRNFFLGREPVKGWGPLSRLDIKKAQEICREELQLFGIDLRDPDQLIGTLSGGERQAVAIARAVYFGAEVVILDEPTSALGVKQSGRVLKFVQSAAQRGIAVVLITHNPHHAYLVGDEFVLLKRGKMTNRWMKEEVTRDELVAAMAGGAELADLAHELGG